MWQLIHVQPQSTYQSSNNQLLIFIILRRHIGAYHGPNLVFNSVTVTCNITCTSFEVICLCCVVVLQAFLGRARENHNMRYRSMQIPVLTCTSYFMADKWALVDSGAMCQDPIHGGSYMVPGHAYCLLGSDCPIVVSRDLLHCHAISAYLSRCLPLCLGARHGLHLMHGVVLVCCLLLLTDWLDVRVMPWSWVPSIGEWLIDTSCDSPLTWYFVSHDRLVLYLLRRTLTCYYTTVPSSYCTWFAVL